MKCRLTLVCLAASLALIGAACSNGADAGPTGDGPGSRAGSVAAPEFPGGLDWYNTGGRPLALDELRGKIVALHFWSGSCVTCVHSLPDLERLSAEAGPAVMVMGVHAPRFTGEATSPAARAAALRNEVDFPFVADNDLAVSRAWGVESQPTTVVIDPTGMIVGVHTGEDLYAALSPVIGSLVDDFTSQLDNIPGDFPLERDGLPATVLAAPAGVAVTARADRLYIADTAHHRIVVASLPDGEVLAVYGSGRPELQDGAAAGASFREPRGLALSADETMLFVADTGNHAIRAVDLESGGVSTVAGTGLLGSLPTSGGQARGTALRSPWDVAVDGDSLYVAMAGANQLWVIDTTAGEAEPIAGTGEAGVADGAALGAHLTRPSGVVVAGDGTLYFTDPEASSVRALDAAGANVTTVAGPISGPFAFGDVDGHGRDVRYQLPLGLAGDGDLLLVTDTLNHALRTLSRSTSEVRTLAGSEPGWRDGVSAQFREPSAIDVVGTTAYVADTGNNVIRLVDLGDGATSTLVLRGIEAFAPTADDAGYRGTVIDVTPAEVAQGPGAVVIDIALPPNHKVNGDAPSSATWSVDGGVVEVDDVSSASLTGAMFPVTLPATFSPGQGALTVDLNLFWCANDAESLCFIEQVRFVVPLTVGAAGEATDVVLYHEIVLPEVP